MKKIIILYYKLLYKLKKLFRVSHNKMVEDILLFVCGNEALPLPLSAEEESVLIEEMQNNNDQAKEKLIEHNLRLVVFIAKRFDNSGVPLEDLISIGAIGLIKAVKTYNNDKKIKLATYASRCIENEILMHLRKIVRIKGEVALEEPLSNDSDGNELLLMDILKTDMDSVGVEIDKVEEKKILWQSINKLAKREREIMMLRFGLTGENEKTQKEVADMMGISQSYISRIEKRILIKIKKEIEKASNM